MHEASRGTMSAQKALKGSEAKMRELLGGTEENSVSSMKGHLILLPKRKQRGIEIEAPPVVHMTRPSLRETAAQKPSPPLETCSLFNTSVICSLAPIDVTKGNLPLPVPEAAPCDA